jgi:hypothetical protein
METDLSKDTDFERFIVVFFCPSRKMLARYLNLGLLHSKSFPLHYSLIKPSFNTVL